MKLELFFLAVLLVAVALAAPSDDDEWEAFKSKHGKKFKDGPHENRRKANFMKRKKDIEKHNKEADDGIHTYRRALNHLSDLGEDEIQSVLGEKGDLPYYMKPGASKNRDVDVVQLDRQKYPSLNWTQHPCMPSVKNQGNCGCCYTFAAAAVASFLNCYFNNNTLVDLSEQQLVDCSTKQGNEGCNGGLTYQAWEYMAQSGITSRAAYPYTATAGTCRSATPVPNFKVRSWAYTSDSTNTTVREESLEPALISHGPIGVSLCVSQSLMQYKSGVYCDSTYKSLGVNGTTNHAVVLVGYGTESGKDYWIIRNSWGTSWGEGGYIRICRGQDMSCISVRPVYPIF